MIRKMKRVFASLVLSMGCAAGWAAGPALAQGACPALALGPVDGLPVLRDACLIGGTDQDFGAMAIPTGPAARVDGVWRGADELRLEGRVSRRLYAAPEGVTPLDAFRNYRQALEAAGFEPLFDCAGADCGRNEAMGRQVIWPNARRLDTLGDLTAYAFTGLEDEHYAALRNPETGQAVGLYVARNGFRRFAETAGRAILHLDIARPAALENRMIDAAAMQSALDDNGKITLDNIYFDFATDVLKPESMATIDEMARLLAENPDVDVYIVGHTDNVGSLESNLDLSRRRAEAVVAALASRGIAEGRAVPAGVAALSPLASNATEDGRARNRRVEMVKR